MAADQRYCLECGLRSGPARLDPVAHARRTDIVPVAANEPGVAAAPAQAALTVPGPRGAALLTLAMLLAGFALGGLGGPDTAVSSVNAGRQLILLTGPPALGALPTPPAADVPPVADELPAVDPPAAAELPEAPAVAAVPITEPPLVPFAPAPPVEDVPLEAGDAEPETTPIPTAGATLPPVEHVWVISLADRALTTTFGPGSPDAYVREELVREGVLLNNFHATARGTTANGVALLSGQGANAATDGDCAQPTEVTPGTVTAGDELQQVEGDGCVYPSTVGTLPEQLTSAGKTWKAYVEEIRPGGRSTAPSCETARSPRNPFTAFKSLTDAADCPQRIVGTDQLAGDLADPTRTPTLSWIIPDPCHDGRDAPCAEGAPAGLPAASAWLRPILDQIRATEAYKQSGLIVLLADRAPRDGPAPDVSARKGAPEGQGGGLVAALLLSPFVTPGQQVAAAYDHFSLLGSLEDLLGVTRLGQAARPGLRTFGPRVFGAFDPAADPATG